MASANCSGSCTPRHTLAPLRQGSRRVCQQGARAQPRKSPQRCCCFERAARGMASAAEERALGLIAKAEKKLNGAQLPAAPRPSAEWCGRELKLSGWCGLLRWQGCSPSATGSTKRPPSSTGRQRSSTSWGRTVSRSPPQPAATRPTDWVGLDSLPPQSKRPPAATSSP